jgi:hypothetical protein
MKHVFLLLIILVVFLDCLTDRDNYRGAYSSVVYEIVALDAVHLPPSIFLSASSSRRKAEEEAV